LRQIKSPIGEFAVSKSNQNDVESLLSELQLDQKAYKTFRKTTLPAAGVAEPVRMTPSAVPEPAPPSSHQEMRALASVLETYSTVDAPPESPHGSRDVDVLDALLGPQGRLRSVPAIRQSRHVPLPAISLISICGGVGTTSIVAALGRLAAISGERALLLDSSSPSLLPLYFGGRTPRPYVSTFFAIGDSRNGATHIISKEYSDPTEKADAWIWKSLDSLAPDSDRIIADLRPEELQKDLGNFFKESISVVTLAPDVRSIVALQRWDSLLKTQSGGGEEAMPPYLLLNSFDSSNSFHLELRDRVAAKFGKRLLPIAIRQDRQVSDALTQGMTIIDYAPRSPVAEDLYRLADWLWTQASVNPAAKLEGARVS
jgi:cellulose biosynthesis protein BcsQ